MKKKSIVICVRVDEDLFGHLLDVAREHDWSIAHVARKFMLSGWNSWRLAEQLMAIDNRQKLFQVEKEAP